jgi:hypothetical protein
MSNYFKNFPLLTYNFGNEVSDTVFQNLTTYVSLVDEIKGNTEFYATGYIRDGERPDTLSYNLYGTTEYYWTFYFLNDDIRESGWPLTESEILPLAKEYYPHYVITTRGDLTTRFLTGQTITGLTSGATGTIRKKNIDLGQIILDTSGTFLVGEQIYPSNEIDQTVTVTNFVEQYNAVHHYEDTNGKWNDIDPYTFIPSASSLIPITNLDRVRARNEELKTIDVFKPEVVTQISEEFNRLLRLE